MRISGVGAPITTAINLRFPLFAELARQYPAAFVKPVLIPSTLSSINRSLFLEYCFISLNLNTYQHEQPAFDSEKKKEIGLDCFG